MSSSLVFCVGYLSRFMLFYCHLLRRHIYYIKIQGALAYNTRIGTSHITLWPGDRVLSSVNNYGKGLQFRKMANLTGIEF